MHKLALATLVAAAATAPAQAAPWNYYVYANSGTTADPLAGFVVQSSGGIDQKWYTTGGSTSDPNAPAIQKHMSFNLSIDFSNPAAVPFTAVLYVGDYREQYFRSIGETIGWDGRTTHTGVQFAFSGIGVYNEATNTLSYSFLNPTVNGGGAATYSSGAAPTCTNGRTSALGKTCTYFQQSSRNWEGLTLNLVFSEDRWSTMTGTLQGIDTFGTGINRTTTATNWELHYEYPYIPVPPSAWLFGSALLGLAASKRRRKR